MYQNSKVFYFIDYYFEIHILKQYLINSSSGLVSQNVSANVNTTKAIELTPGETAILDVQLSTYGTTLFSTCGRIVRVWDLRMYLKLVFHDLLLINIIE